MADDYAYDDPMRLFETWFEQAKACEAMREPTAMNLATADADGVPSNRVVLLKKHDMSGFSFFTNYEGRKSIELQANPKASLCFYWMPLDKQIRIEGEIVRAPDEVSDAYFASRHRGSQIGAWASAQSQPLERFELLEEKVRALEAQYEGKEIPRPPHWGGWTLLPHRMEFWHQEAYRLHRRWVYTREGDSWSKGWLYP